MYEVFLLDTRYLENIEVFEENYARMSVERQNKITACKREKDQRLSLGAGILIDNWLQTKGESIQRIEMEVSVKGKLVIKEHPQWHFNVSHSGDYAALVVGDSPVGIDIEQIRGMKLSVMKIAFTKEEANRVHSAESEEEQMRIFYEIWTGKESYVKATGEGMAKIVDRDKGWNAEPGHHVTQQLDAPMGYVLAVTELL